MGGGGHSHIYTGGGVPAHPKRGGGVLGTGTTKKKGGGGSWARARVEKGGLRHGHESKRGGGLKNWSCKQTILVTDVAQRVFLELIY